MKLRFLGIGMLFTLWLSACGPGFGPAPSLTPAEETPRILSTVTQAAAILTPSPPPTQSSTASPILQSTDLPTSNLPITPLPITQLPIATCLADSLQSFAYLPNSIVLLEILPLEDGSLLLRGLLDDKPGTWLAKTDPAGMILWQNVYGSGSCSLRPGPNGSFVLEFGRTSLEIAGDGSLVGNGYSVPWFQRNADDSLTLLSGGRVAHLNSAKNWAYSIKDFGGFALPASDGGAWFAYAGVYTDTSVYYAPQCTDIKVIKILPGGEVIQRVYGKLVGDETLEFLYPANDGGALLAGSHAYEELAPDYDIWLMKLNASGGLSWQTTLKLPPHHETLTGIYFLKTGYLAVLTTPVENDNPLLVRLKPNGSLAWQKILTSSRGTVQISAVAETADGGLLLAGETWEKNNVYWLARLDSRGNLLWEKTLGYYGLADAPGTSVTAILPLADGEILLGGSSDLVGNAINAASSAWLAQIPDSGQVFGLISLQPGKFTVISSLASRPNNLPNEVLALDKIFWDETEAEVTPIDLQPVSVCLPAEASFPTPAALPSLTPSLTPTPSFTRDLYLSNPPMQGDDVRMLQERLLELGYSEVGLPDGIFGKMSEAAVRRFQQNNGLEVDGYLGPKTWRTLFSPDAARGG
ncbi:MAG: peptidoglycan-binding domain-containing protein [Anaerolineales bacterium]|jgi:hypothetical protein|nr:peptidoglycan-binding domain-containing protein [Anaerolineales bacterium]